MEVQNLFSCCGFLAGMQTLATCHHKKHHLRCASSHQGSSVFVFLHIKHRLYDHSGFGVIMLVVPSHFSTVTKYASKLPY